MPSKEEVKDIHNVGKFLKKTFGEYAVISILCTPDIEIHDINVNDFKDMHVDFSSARKSYGDEVLEILTEKLKNKEEFTEEEHYWRLLLPYISREDEEEFEKKYSQLLDSYYKANLELPKECKLNTYNLWHRML